MLNEIKSLEESLSIAKIELGGLKKPKEKIIPVPYPEKILSIKNEKIREEKKIKILLRVV